MKTTLKIIFLIIVQISLILASFGILEYYESQQKPFFDIINSAGKNRYLTEKTLMETISYVNGYAPSTDPLITLTELEQNINNLKNIGTSNSNVPVPLPNDSLTLLNSVNQDFITYKTAIEEIHASAIAGKSMSRSDFTNLQEKTNGLISSSDKFVQEIANYNVKLSDFVIQIQYVLMSINVASHILVIVLILRYIKSEYTQKRKIDKLAIIGELTARLVHDIRNPLSVIKNTSNLIKLRYPDLTEGANEQFERLDRSVDRIVYQIDDVLEYLRQPMLIQKAVSLRKILESVIEVLDIPDGIKITLPEKDYELLCDVKKMEVVFVNLITNAIHAMNSSGSISITAYDDPKWMMIEIHDTGTGIPKELKEKIFEPLFTTKQTGTGLGLISCKNIIEAHDGSITVKSTGETGTTFLIKLPKVLHK